jgi:hypothetical protein
MQAGTQPPLSFLPKAHPRPSAARRAQPRNLFLTDLSAQPSAPVEMTHPSLSLRGAQRQSNLNRSQTGDCHGHILWPHNGDSRSISLPCRIHTIFLLKIPTLLGIIQS